MRNLLFIFLCTNILNAYASQQAAAASKKSVCFHGVSEPTYADTQHAETHQLLRAAIDASDKYINDVEIARNCFRSVTDRGQPAGHIHILPVHPVVHAQATLLAAVIRRDGKDSIKALREQVRLAEYIAQYSPKGPFVHPRCTRAISCMTTYEIK